VANQDPRTYCDHTNAVPVYWMDHDWCGNPAIIDTYIECPDCDSKFTVEEFDRLTKDEYERASAEARYFDYGLDELYGHLLTSEAHRGG
jgi:hypothetical protein